MWKETMYFCSMKMLFFPAASRKITASIEKKFVFSYIISVLISFHIKMHTLYYLYTCVLCTFTKIFDRNFSQYRFLWKFLLEILSKFYRNWNVDFLWEFLSYLKCRFYFTLLEDWIQSFVLIECAFLNENIIIKTNKIRNINFFDIYCSNIFLFEKRFLNTRNQFMEKYRNFYF